MIHCTRRHSLLLEVLISFAIVALCILPILYPHVYILQSQREMLQVVELDHIVNLVYADTLEKLYLNEIHWDDIIHGKEIKIDAEKIKDCGFGCSTPYTGTVKFVEIKHKPKKPEPPENATLYLYEMAFKFSKQNKRKTKDGVEKDKEYKYLVVIKKKE